MYFLALLAAIAVHSPAAAAPEWRQAREYEVILSSFDIQPQTMRLRAGEPLRLRLINNSGQPHSFSARAFFAAGQVRQREAKALADGSIEVGPWQSRELVMVPAAGRYSARCSNLFHRIMGMTARILVE